MKQDDVSVVVFVIGGCLFVCFECGCASGSSLSVLVPVPVPAKTSFRS